MLGVVSWSCSGNLCQKASAMIAEPVVIAVARSPVRPGVEYSSGGTSVAQFEV